ncbi:MULTISPECIES: hypothetical protein [unclassified Acidiplasma]|uniref:hypothetical protein n=1 Tax=unclassified Acidiplasma TaxID=2641301 RepID=UPI0005DF785A|nr:MULTISPECIES: hypothetical protein [unclassified Acidiplasma]KJE49859.1 hypothetical protein TZ01_01870 [Acidiplasma sp. MBA-1]WMT55024.1 MAG: hypothetical protein RE470_08945 [Acidiplasma sp.]
MSQEGKWFEVINGIKDDDYNQRLFSTLGNRFGVFYYKKSDDVHVYIYTNSRPSFVKEAIDIDPIDSLPKAGNSYISVRLNDPYYYSDHDETGIELKGLKAFLSSLDKNQGILIWFYEYNKKSEDFEYSIKEDKFRVRIILIEKEKHVRKNQKIIHEFADSRTQNQDILKKFREYIDIDFTWKNIKKPTYKIFDPEVKFSIKEMMNTKKRTIYTYRAEITKMMIMDYSQRIELRLDNKGRGPEASEIAHKYLESKNFGGTETDINFDSRMAQLKEIASSDYKILMYGKNGDGKLEVARKLMGEILKSNRKIFILQTAMFDPFKNIVSDDEAYKVVKISLSADYAGRLIVRDGDDATLLAEKLWAEITTKSSSEKDPALFIYNVGDVIPRNDSGVPVYESEFWSSFFNLAMKKPSLIGLIYDGDGQTKLPLYTDKVIKTYMEGNETSFSIEETK